MRKFILIFFVVISVINFLLVHNTYSIETCDHNCTKCHHLKNDEAQSLLKDVFPDVKVLGVRPFPFKGLWEIAIEGRGQKGIVYVDFSKKHIVSGAIFDLKTKANLTQERQIEISKVDVSKIPLDDAIVMGAKEAKHRVIVFSDPDCPYCAKLHQEMKKVIEKRKDIAFYIKMFPLKIHPGAYEKAKAIVCEKSLALLDDAFEKKQLSKPKCETSVVDENLKLGEKLGISGAPALIMPNGSVIPGYKDADSLIALIDKLS